MKTITKIHNMKTLALDIGDVWCGSAISDALGITAQPYQTVPLTQLEDFLKDTLAQEQIKTIVVGYPKTMKGTQSAQTKKIIDLKEMLEKKFSGVAWVLWDERLSSKQASSLKKTKTKADKIASHSIAAAIILTGYLLFASQQPR